MSTISTDKNLIKVYYNAGSINDKELLSYLKASKKELFAVDITKDNLTELQWSEILSGLGKKANDIIDANHSSLVDQDQSHSDFSENDWLKILVRNPEIVYGAIVLIGKNHHYFRSPKSVIKFIADTADSKNTERE